MRPSRSMGSFLIGSREEEVEPQRAQRDAEGIEGRILEDFSVRLCALSGSKAPGVLCGECLDWE